MKRLKFTLQLFGISLAIVGWYFEKAERYEWVVRVFAPNYARTLTAYERMLLSATIYHCINNATYVLLIRPQITSYLLGISLDTAKRGSQCRAQFVLGCEIAIVSTV